MSGVLVILRHGKAAAHEAYPTDHARPLVARGHAEAEFIGRHLATHGPRVGGVVSSPVLRALTTAQVVARHVGCGVAIDERLTTDAATGPIVELAAERLGGLGATGGCVVIAGHNPTLSQVLAEMLGAGERGRGDLHTGEMAVVEFGKWVGAGCGRLLDRVRLEDEQH